MKRIISIGLLLFSAFHFSQRKEMMQALKNNQPEKALQIGKRLLETDPNSFETNFLFARAYNDKNDFENSLVFIEKANTLSNENWQKSWVLVESIRTNFGLNRVQDAQQNYQNASQIDGTKNSQDELKYLGVLLGFDEIYKDWYIVQTENLTFYFQNGISESEIKKRHRIKTVGI